MKKIYLIGSLRNPNIPAIANILEVTLGVDVFADWFAAGKIADDSWQMYETLRGKNYQQALQGRAAKHIFAFDKHHLDTCDAAVLVMPCGKSGHLEAGYLVGRGVPVWVLFDAEPERYDQMYQLVAGVHFDVDSLVKSMEERL